MDKWIVDVKGESGRVPFEISVLLESNTHGRDSYGWFGDDKLLITHNGGPCRWPLIPPVWDRQITLAHEVADRLNAIQNSEPPTTPAGPQAMEGEDG